MVARDRTRLIDRLSLSRFNRATQRLGDLFDTEEPLMVVNDEGHHAYWPRENLGRIEAEEQDERLAATVSVEGLDKINEACGIGISVNLSTTPFYPQGSGYPVRVSQSAALRAGGGARLTSTIFTE